MAEKKVPLISIIMPVYNCEDYVASAINSVLLQSYGNWELLIVDDGSTDNSSNIITSFSDHRIILLSQTNQGVSVARNHGLSKMQGKFFCFLDADDIMPPYSISSRLEVFEANPQTDFVDGGVKFMDVTMSPINKVYRPNFYGHPLLNLIRLDQKCFAGNTWMIRNHNLHYRFIEEITHCEDLLFYISICKQRNGLYQYTQEDVLHYRQTNEGAMSNLNGLESGYLYMIWYVNKKLEVGFLLRLKSKLKIMKIMFLSYLFDGRDIRSAFGSILRIALK